MIANMYRSITILQTLYHALFYVLFNPHDGPLKIIIIFILQLKKLRSEEMKWLAQSPIGKGKAVIQEQKSQMTPKYSYTHVIQKHVNM